MEVVKLVFLSVILIGTTPFPPLVCDLVKHESNGVICNFIRGYINNICEIFRLCMDDTQRVFCKLSNTCGKYY